MLNTSEDILKNSCIHLVLIDFHYMKKYTVKVNQKCLVINFLDFQRQSCCYLLLLVLLNMINPYRFFQIKILLFV